MATQHKGLAQFFASNFLESQIANLDSKISAVENRFLIGRVTDIILNEDHPLFVQVGKWNGVGTILYEQVDSNGDKGYRARPFFPQITSYPLINELVLLVLLPNKGIGKRPNNESYYYINMINLWNSPHHNAYPRAESKDKLTEEEKADYTEGNTVRRVTDDGTGIKLNSNSVSQNTFRERKNIHPLLSFPGDIIYQGRWGNSIRFGSTVKLPQITSPIFTPPLPSINTNNWSNVGVNGSPITIIRNGQNPEGPTEEEKLEGWKPVTEDINKDPSSIYITSTQQIPIEVSKPMVSDGSAYKSYNTPPTFPSRYAQPQVLINSDRLVFNSKKDHILISSAKSIFLGSNHSVNTETPKCIITSPSIQLGGKDASEPLILGESFLSILRDTLSQLSTLMGTLQGLKDWPTGEPEDNITVPPSATDTQGVLEAFIKAIDSKDFTSKTTKTL